MIDTHRTANDCRLTMKKRMALWLGTALGGLAFATLAVAQDNADIAPNGRGLYPFSVSYVCCIPSSIA